MRSLRCIATSLKALCIATAATTAILPPPSVLAYTRYEAGISTNATLLWMDDDSLERRLRDIKSLGATWVRVDFSWAKIQADDADHYDWTMYDKVVRAASRHNLKILAILGYTPHWARDPRCTELAENEIEAQRCSPAHSDTFARFARAAVTRYHWQSVRGWEIWNEPNLTRYWKTVQSDKTLFVDPIMYARIANAAATEIRRKSDAAILTGGLSPLFEPHRSTGMRQSEYLATVLPHLNRRLFNGISIHPYSWPVSPNKAADYNAFYTVDNGPDEYNLRAVMRKAGWSRKQIWATEYGSSTKGLRWVAQPTPNNRPDHVSEDTQAQLVTQGMAGWYKKENVGPLFIHSDSDQWLATHRNEGGFGLRRSDGTEKPAYAALKAASKQLGVNK